MDWGEESASLAYVPRAPISPIGGGTGSGEPFHPLACRWAGAQWGGGAIHAASACACMTARASETPGASPDWQ